MKSSARSRFGFVLALTLLLAAVCLQASAQQVVAPTPDVPKDAGFRLKGLDGKFYDTSQMRGDVLVVSFGSTWCVPCISELVAIEELKEEYAGKPVKFLWVNIEDPRRTTNNILKYFVKERGLTFPVLRDPGGETLNQYSTATRIPVMVFFDRDGHLSAPVGHGMMQDITIYKQHLRERVNALLAARADAPAALPAAK
ncbi:MAG TPA: TlpA disulfide reductase family protein [Pyrinomonadaceae bacterium]|nr:TlpA disulfide reductase family protein [Pyrinomonadaceae bacterium]